MSQAVMQNAMCQCSFGMAPTPLTVIPAGPPVNVEGQMMATIMDFAPGANIKPFGMCQSLANPTVASATAAAQGVLTPMPCMPVPLGPWKPGSPTVLVGNKPALTDKSILNCCWGGVIKINPPIAMKTMVP